MNGFKYSFQVFKIPPPPMNYRDDNPPPPPPFIDQVEPDMLSNSLGVKLNTVVCRVFTVKDIPSIHTYHQD